MRTFSGILAAFAVAAIAGTASAGQSLKYASPKAAFEQGLGAYKAGYYEMAIPALEEAAAKGSESNRFFAEYYLARIFSDNNGPHTDHAKAYLLYQKLAEENADMDPDENIHRRPFVARALRALAGYLRRGVEELKVRPDLEGAVKALRHAATFFGDREAQFELAKIYLGGGGTDEDVKRALHYLSTLSEESHPGAQALLAELLWRGRYVKKDERRAFALITMAVENAPASERNWIEDTYTQIYCATSQGTRTQADGFVAMWRKMFARPAESGNRMGLGGQTPQSERKCSNGEVVDINRGPPTVSTLAPTTPSAAPPDAVRGSAGGFGGMRDAGTVERPRR